MDTLATPGLYWTGDNPAGLALEVDSNGTVLSVGARNATGSYRRPLDPVGCSTQRVRFDGWRRTGAHGATLGHVSLDFTTLPDGASSPFAQSASGPFATADTSHPAVTRPTVSLEGLQGFRFGRWLTGVGAAYTALENNSNASPAAQIGRGSGISLVVGLGRMLARSRVGAAVRHTRFSETADLISNPAFISVYSLDGYRDVPPVQYTPLAGPFIRRMDRASTVASLDAAGRLGATMLSGYAGGGEEREQRLSDLEALSSPVDRWNTTVVASGAAARRALPARARATLLLAWQARNSHGVRATDTAAFVAKANRGEMRLELRRDVSAASWSQAAVVTVARTGYSARDDAVSVHMHVVAWTSSVAVDVGKPLTSRVELHGGAGFAQYVPRAIIPSPTGHGDAYATFIAPDIEIAAATARTSTASLAIRFAVRGALVSAQAWTGRTRAVDRPDPSVPLPAGTRDLVGITVAIQRGPQS